ncbi:MAG: hypothetical protein ABEJ03_04445 [Candidatus Nanohaloarchaea archaeon]
MDRNEVREVLDQYRDARSERRLIELLKNRLIEEMEGWDASSERQRHDLNMMIREIEEELDYVESQKLAEFDPGSG